MIWFILSGFVAIGIVLMVVGAILYFLFQFLGFILEVLLEVIFGS